MPVPQELLDLAPVALPNYRTHRFDGAGYEVPLARFAPDDRAILVRLYAAVDGLPRLTRAAGPAGPTVEAFIRGADRLIPDAQQLGVATRSAGGEDAAVRKAVHDIRGGGLAVVIGSAGLLDLLPDDPGIVRACVDAARDHAKIMRNLLPEIDPVVREADEAAKAHDIRHFAAKWDGMAVRRGDDSVAVAVRCSFAGSISARCLETSSIDRVVYNLINNAVRFAADGAVVVWIFPVGEGLVRWVVENRVAADQRVFLATAAPDLGRLYAGGVTRGGTGVGLANCAELVADCFGLTDSAEAVAGGYLGAVTRGDRYLAWFHWPALVG